MARAVAAALPKGCTVTVASPTLRIGPDGARLPEVGCEGTGLGPPAAPGAACCGKLVLEVPAACPAEALRPAARHLQALLALLLLEPDGACRDPSAFEHAVASVPPPTWHSAVETWRLHGGVAAGGAPKFRASAVRDGSHGFSSVQLLPAIGDGVTRANPGWVVELTSPELEVVAIVAWEHVVVGITIPSPDAGPTGFAKCKLISEPMADADARAVAALPKTDVALRPSSARCLLGLAEAALLAASGGSVAPSRAVVLDPFAGTGTITVVAAELGWGHAVAGEMLSGPAEVLAAVLGLKRRSCAVDGVRLNAARLGLTDVSVDAIVSDLPFGMRCLKSEDLRKLYPTFVRDAARVLAPGGVLVALTALNGPGLLDATLALGPWAPLPGLPRILPVNIGGERAAVVLARRCAGAGEWPQPTPSRKQQRRQAHKQRMAKRAAVAEAAGDVPAAGKPL